MSAGEMSSLPGTMVSSLVAGFLLFDAEFPRSPVLCMIQMNRLLTRLKSRYALPGGSRALGRLDEIEAMMASQTIGDAIGIALSGHAHIDNGLTLGRDNVRAQPTVDSANINRDALAWVIESEQLLYNKGELEDSACAALRIQTCMGGLALDGYRVAANSLPSRFDCARGTQ